MAVRYATLADLQGRVGTNQLILWTDDDGTGVQVDAVANQALEDAADEVDAYLSAKYLCPLTSATIPGPVRRLTLDLAIWNLAKRRHSASEQQRAAYEDSIRLLRDIASGKASLGIDPPATDASYVACDIDCEDRVLSRTTMEGF